MKHLAKIFLFTALLGISVLGARPASATVAANTKITNTATLYYNDGSGVRSTSATVDVTVTLVSVLPTITSNGPVSVPYTSPTDTASVAFTVTANSNGPETYTLNPSVAGNTNTSGGSVSPVPSFVLGATVTVTGSTTTVLQVPSDGTADGSVNGLQVGDTVVVNGEVRTVTAVSDPATGTATITLNAPLGTAPGVGISVLERVVVSVPVAPGNIQTNGTDVTVTVNATVTSGAGTTAPAVSAVATFTSGNATLVKYVRNITRASGNAAGAGGKTIIVNAVSNTYYRSGVTAQPGDTLEYVLEVTNVGTGAATSCRVVDQFPATFVTFLAGAYGPSKDIFYADEAGTGSFLTQDSGDDAGTLAGATLTVNVGTGATFAASGSVGVGKKVLVAYQLKVK